MSDTKKVKPLDFIGELLEVQKEIKDVEKTGENPYFKSSYTTLTESIKSCKEILNKHNIIVLQPIQSDSEGVYVCTTLLHVSGEKLESKMSISEVKSNDPQARGSAITYARRYSLKSILCMADEDDDGEKAMDRINNYKVLEVKKLVKETETEDKLEEFLEKAGVAKVEDLPGYRADFLIKKLREKKNESN